MKNIIWQFAAVAALALAVGCKEEAGGGAAAAIPATLPGNVCVVSGEKIGEGGMKPVTIDYKGNKITFCCDDCPKDFQKNPDKYVAALKSGKPLPKEEHAH